MKSASVESPSYQLLPDGDFLITNYNTAKPFASFFPGVAGPHGIPMWVFYVNRGQCVCSMGTEDKDHSMMEFLPANWAYQLVSEQGFRTFVKILQRRDAIFYEPFQTRYAFREVEREQRMIVRPAELVIEEANRTFGLLFRVEYFTIPEEPFAALVRTLSITNTGRRSVSLEVLDGLPLIIPFGVDNYNLKHMRRLVESFVECINYETGIPFFKGRVKQEDKPEVVRIREGHFYIGFTVSRGGRPQLARPVVDPVQIFGPLTDYDHPRRFLEHTPYHIPAGAILENRLPCAMGLSHVTIGSGQTWTYHSVIGRASSVTALKAIARTVMDAQYLARKRQENIQLVSEICQFNFVNTAWHAFNLYCQQNFLDNTLRGGLPVGLCDHEKTTILHLYSRLHGDLERDYNNFRLTPTPYSQGNGNFRDVNQNRRCDLFINPAVEDENIVQFFNLIQLDGFNPLVIKPESFSFRRKEGVMSVLKRALTPVGAKAVYEHFADRRFLPGELLLFLHQQGYKSRLAPDALMAQILGECNKHQESEFGHGFWTDHWTYNMDLLENYLAVYPDRLRYVLLQRDVYTFYDSDHVVMPRTEKYVIWDGKPMQLGAVRVSPEKQALFRGRHDPVHVVRTDYGRGKIYRTTLLVKLISLAVNKLASLDPFGVGIEMEADKPNWYDALNGLPGLFGSSISETLELKRLLLFIQQSLIKLGISDDETVAVYEEAADLLHQLIGLLRDARQGGKCSDPFVFWDQATTAKESYRARTLLGVSGREENVSIARLREFLDLALWKIECGIEKARDPHTGLLRTYFRHEPVEYRVIRQDGSVKMNPRGLPCFEALKFRQIPLPLFLEGLVHYLRVERNPDIARSVYQNVRKSGLFDRKLQMYKVNESLKDEPLEIGRTRTFSPGWLENESIWMHMEYKYLLELVRCGLIDEFYRDIQTMMPPFMDPARYGRSILENSSFIASSANPDPSLHGTGFVARLSGSTAEFIHILYLLTVGEKPFALDEKGGLVMRLNPSLRAHMFTKQPTTYTLLRNGKPWRVTLPRDSLSVMFLGSVLITYHNPSRKNTYGRQAVRPTRWKLTYNDGRVATHEGPELPEPYSRDVRERKVCTIDVVLS